MSSSLRTSPAVRNTCGSSDGDEVRRSVHPSVSRSGGQSRCSSLSYKRRATPPTCRFVRVRPNSSARWNPASIASIMSFRRGTGSSSSAVAGATCRRGRGAG